MVSGDVFSIPQNALVSVSQPYFYFFWSLFLGIILVYITCLNFAPGSYRRKRLWLSCWRRLTVWEFWPLWLFYPPIIVYIIYLGLRHRCLTLFTASNPAMTAGGFIGEEKSKILTDLSGPKLNNEYLARWTLISRNSDSDHKISLLESFLQENGLDYPVVLKPDEGQRGLGVAIVKTVDQARTYLEQSIADTLVQEYVPGHEYGVFYYRIPGDESGHVFSITAKVIPEILGDGERTIEHLILDDDRAVGMATIYLKRFADRLSEIPPEGQRIPIAELGTHCLGAIFLDGGHLHSPQLTRAMDELCKTYEGFYFGRIDLKAPSPEHLQEGRGLKVLEVNGVTSEATHIFDPKHSLLNAYRVLMEQWRIAFRIGAINRERGIKPVPLGELFSHYLEVARRQKKIASSNAEKN